MRKTVNHGERSVKKFKNVVWEHPLYLSRPEQMDDIIIFKKKPKKCHNVHNFLFVSVLDDNREDTISRINSKLPPCIKVQYIKKVTKNFNCKSACDGRTYLYLLPTFAFAPIVPINDAKGKYFMSGKNF